ncbi:MAG TPA: hypothetical protein VNG51_03850 [Ktedonobacteraceae bacterium]|nr:hypothetical protein [Ktedonobacteraceae bacterium]
MCRMYHQQSLPPLHRKSRRGTRAALLRSFPDNTTINVASLVYNANALPDTITFDTSAGQSSPLATEQFTYDANLRPAQTTATWQSGSGSTGQIYQEQRTYDPLGNVSSLATSLSPVPGKSNSGGAETQDFCYNEQNQLVWAGNSGTEPGAGNGTCGSAPLASSLYNASYSNSFVYTHLGQLWKGPLNGSSTQYKYLYCSKGMNPYGYVGATRRSIRTQRDGVHFVY